MSKLPWIQFLNRKLHLYIHEGETHTQASPGTLRKGRIHAGTLAMPVCLSIHPLATLLMSNEQPGTELSGSLFPRETDHAELSDTGTQMHKKCVCAWKHTAKTRTDAICQHVFIRYINVVINASQKENTRDTVKHKPAYTCRPTSTRSSALLLKWLSYWDSRYATSHWEMRNQSCYTIPAIHHQLRNQDKMSVSLGAKRQRHKVSILLPTTLGWQKYT